MSEEKNEVVNNVEESTETTVNKNKSGKATAGFVLGLCSIIAWFIPLIGYPVTILGIIFSALGIKSAKKTFAVIGLICSIIFLIATLINSIVGAILMASMLMY